MDLSTLAAAKSYAEKITFKNEVIDCTKLNSYTLEPQNGFTYVFTNVGLSDITINVDFRKASFFTLFFWIGNYNTSYSNPLKEITFNFTGSKSYIGDQYGVYSEGEVWEFVSTDGLVSGLNWGVGNYDQTNIS